METLPRRRPTLMVVALYVLASLTLLTPVPVLAQAAPGGQAMGIGLAMMFLFMFAIFTAIYIYMALALQSIAKKTNTENDWWAWVPILQQILMLNIAKKPVWWIVLFFVPVANFVVIILTFMGIAEAVNKPNWWGILMVVPEVNLIVPGYLAWAD
jgi:hypothetical protein